MHLKMCPYLGITLQGMPACSEYVKVGGALKVMQREPPPPKVPFPLHSPSASLKLMNGVNTINATFSLPPPSCKPVFTPLRISGNVMYVCLCVSARDKKNKVRWRAL